MRSVRIIAAVLFAAAVAATGCTAHATVHPAAAPAPASSTPPPTTTADPTPNSPAGGPTGPTTTLALGRIERLNAVPAIGTTRAVAVGKGVILATSNRGRRWVRIWHGPQELPRWTSSAPPPAGRSARASCWAPSTAVSTGSGSASPGWARCARSTSPARPEDGAWPAETTSGPQRTGR
jgi:hypothetical protein